STASPRTPEGEEARSQQLLTLPFHDRFAALGAGAPVAVRRSARVPTPSVRLRQLPDHAGRSAPLPSTTGATARRATTGRAEPAPRRSGSTKVPPTRREGLPHSERPPERAVIERAMDALRDVPGLVRLQEEDPLLGKVRGALG
ncbi:unnamed protein product, partial [Laminaria digitata]